MTKLGILVGSLRSDSYSKKWAQAIHDLYPTDYQITWIEIGNLPLYNQDLDQDNPQVYTDFRQTIKEQDALLIVTPEHNRGLPAALKNALDIGSRPAGESVWAGKVTLPVSHSISNMSGFGASQHLKQALSFLDMPFVLQPEIYLAHSGDYFDDEGKLNNNKTQEFLAGAVKKHMELINLYR